MGERLPSILLRYDNQMLKTTRLTGDLRSLAWDSQGRYIILVGNNGRVLRSQEDEVITLDSGTRQNLRGVAQNSVDGTTVIVGNEGTILSLDEDYRFAKIEAPTTENLRSASWNAKGTRALIAGNRGTLLTYSKGSLETVDCANANLRRISWRPKSDQALITSNCFAEEFIPSPNLFSFDASSGAVFPLNEGRADFIGVDWKPTGELALVVGYDVVWHNGFIGKFEGTVLSPIPFENRRVYPVAVSWKPSGELVALATATGQPGMGKGSVYLWDGKSLESIYTNDDFFFGTVAWDSKGKCLAALASSQTRTFNCWPNSFGLHELPR